MGSLNDSTYLRNYLLENYTRHFRPVLDQSRPLNLAINLSPRRVNSFDEVSGVLSFLGMLQYVWKDEQIQWNSADFGRTTTIRISVKDVWIPNLLLSNSAGQNNFLDTDVEGLSVLYTHTGNASMQMGFQFETACDANVRYYPFDTQYCDVSFANIGSFAHEVNMSFYSTQAQVSGFLLENGQWEVSFHEKSIDQFSPLPQINYQIILKRIPTFVILNLFLPTLFLVTVNIFVFLLPIESGERISYSITLLLSLSVFMTLVANNFPENSHKIPLVCVLFMLEIFNSAMILFSVVLGMRIYHKHKELPVSPFYRKFTLFMSSGCKRHRAVENNEYQGDHGNRKIQEIDMDKNHISPEFNDIHNGDKSEFESISWQDVSSAIDKFLLWFFIIISFLETVLFFLVTIFGN